MSSYVSTILSNLTLSMVHTVVWIRSTIVTLYCWMALSLTSPFKHKGVKTDLILQDSKRLKKIPLHLAVVLCEEDIIYNNLSSIVCWAFSFGIQLVSIYDLKGLKLSFIERFLTFLPFLAAPTCTGGEVKRSICTLKDSLEGEYSTFTGLCNQELTISVLKDHYSPPDIITGSNNLIVLSGEDGCSGLTNLAVQLCKDSVSGVILPRDIDVSRINTALIGGIQEPNLILVCGDTHSLIGYPPWWTRLTEIMWLSSHHKISYQQFLTVLTKYANCQQRFGK